MFRTLFDLSLTRDRPINWVQGTVVEAARPAVPGLGSGELNGFLSLGGYVDADEESMAQSLVDTAIELVARYTGYEPVQRAIQIKWDIHPESVRRFSGITTAGGDLAPWLKIPRWPIQSVDAVTSGGDLVPATDYETDLESNPPRLSFIAFHHGEIAIDVTTGPVSLDPRFKQAVLAAAAFMYEHRGCKFDSALRDSGALGIARSLRVAVGGL